MLRAGRRLLRPGGRLGFLTIHLAPGLSGRDRRRALAAGPPAAGPDPTDLLTRAGFADVRAVDVSDDYLATARAWRASRVRHRESLRPVDPALYDDRIARHGVEIAAIEAGLLRRSLLLAHRAGRA